MMHERRFGALRWSSWLEDYRMFAEVFIEPGQPEGTPVPGVEPPVLMLVGLSTVALLDGARKWVGLESEVVLWETSVEGVPRDFQLTPSGEVALLEGLDDSSRVTVRHATSGKVVYERTLSGLRAGWLACLPDNEFATTDDSAGDLLVFGREMRRIPIGDGLHGVWSAGDHCVVAWRGGSRLVIFDLPAWSVRTIEVDSLDIEGAAISRDGEFMVLTRCGGMSAPPLRVDLRAGRAVELATHFAHPFLVLSPDGSMLATLGVLPGVYHLGHDGLRSVKQYRNAAGFAFGPDGSPNVFEHGALRVRSWY